LRLVLDEPKDEDEKYEVDGLTYLVEKDLNAKAGTIKVDYVNNGWQQGFSLSSSEPLSQPGGMSCGSCSC